MTEQDQQRITRWQGASGRICDFLVDGVGSRFQPIAGLFIFCTAAPDGEWQAVYAGESKNLEETLTTGLVHLPELACVHQAQSTHISTMRVDSPAERVAMLEDLIRQLDPPCNRPQPV